MPKHFETICATLATTLTSIGFAFSSLPAMAQSVPTAVEKGRVIYDTAAGVGCKSCHGTYGEGKVGPPNRGVNESTIREALDKIGPMQFLRDQLKDDDIRQIAAYTDWMGQHLLQRVLLKRGRFIPEVVTIHPGTAIQLVIENTGSEPSSLNTDAVGEKIGPIPPRDSGSLIWKAPTLETKVVISCRDCKIKDGTLTIEVSKAAKPYVPPRQPKIVAKK
jgi:cytochrome c553